MLPFLVLFGDHDKDPNLQTQRMLKAIPMVQLMEQQAQAAQLDFTHVVMHGYGHEQPPGYLKLIGAWVRGEKLPEVK